LRARLMAETASGESFVARPRSASPCSLSQTISMKPENGYGFQRLGKQRRRKGDLYQRQKD